MTAVKTTGNQGETHSDPAWEAVARLVTLEKKLDHIEELAHLTEQRCARIEEFIDEHRPALARGMALMDPGKAVRSMLPGKRKV